MLKNRYSGGFTLIELSVVLLIIGLIVGGVLVGQDLVKTAGMRKTATELEKYQTALLTFKTKYNCLAGDCAHATDYFGTDPTTGCPSNGFTNTCNGNGDSYLNGWSAGSTVNVENIYTWGQLSLARLIPSIDTDVVYLPGTAFPLNKGGATFIAKFPGLNIPASAFSPTIGYNIYSVDPTLTSWGAFPPNLPVNQLVLEIASANADGSWDDLLQAAGFTALQAKQLDSKLDDGNPNSGRIQSKNALYAGVGNPYTTCLSGNSYATTVTTGTGCMTYYMLAGF